MKKVYSLLILLLQATLLVSCGGTSSSSSSVSSSSSSVSSSSSTSTYVQLNTNITDETTLTASYLGSDFDTDGIGQVTLLSCIDGDTATFVSGDLRIRLRFNGINTPESTGKIDPWGKAASKYTCAVLQSATEIVLENEVNIFGKFDNTGSRYMGWVWYKTSATSAFRLLNLELVELAFTRNFMFDDDSKYFTQFRAADEKTVNSGRRVYGEVDPSYDYSTTAQEVSLKEVLTNFTEYDEAGTKLRVEVLVQRFIGDHMFVRDVFLTEDEDTGEVDYGAMYAFAGYNSGLGGFLRVGDIIKIYCRVGSFNGSMQLSDLVTTTIGREGLEIVSRDNPITIEAVDETTDLDDYLGKIVSSDVTVSYIGNTDDSGSYTVYAEIVGTTTRLNIRINSNVTPNYGESYFIIEDSYHVTGGLAKYEVDSSTSYQIVLGNNTALSYADASKIIQ